MEDYKIYKCEDKSGSKVNPDFIYNRFDLWGSNALQGEVQLYCYQDDNTKFMFEVLYRNSRAELGIHLMRLNEVILKRIIDFVFQNSKVTVISYQNGLVKLGDFIEHSHYRIELPESHDELDLRLSSKGRYNIKREKRILNEDFGEYKVVNYPALDERSKELWEHYFKYKNNTHNVNYGFTPQEYCDNYHVTDIYALILGQDRIASVVLSCEQCPIVYIENLTYDTDLSKYSPGQILYDEYLKSLIKKGISEIFLLGGNYSYKKRYASILDTVYNCTVYKNSFIETKYKLKNFVNKGLRYIKRKVFR